VAVIPPDEETRKAYKLHAEVRVPKEKNMFGLGLPELLVILAIILLLFGPKRLKSLGSDLGAAIKGFRTAVTDEDKTAAKDSVSEAKVIEGEVNSSGTGKDSTVKQNSNV
jgi:sec-independent protein translocase protein TatA